MRANWNGKRRMNGALTVRAFPCLRRRMLAAAVATAAAALATGAPAQALEQHALSGVFGKSFESSAGGSLSQPSAVAVNESSGDVYVLDKGNSRVVRFGPRHEFIEAWGFGVRAGNKEYEQCAAGEKCVPGIAGFRSGQFDEPDAIAVDNASGSPSKGDVYVSANSTGKKAAIYKFTSAGVFVGALRLDDDELGPVDGIAVDGTGIVWVEREDETEDFQITRYSNAEKSKLLGEPSEPIAVPDELQEEGLTFEEARPTRPGFALDAKDDLYITYAPGGLDAEATEEEVKELKKKGSPAEAFGHPCQQHACFVAKVPVAVVGEGKEEKVEEVEAEGEAVTAATAEVDGESAGGVAVDGATGAGLGQDVFVDNLDAVAAFTSSGTLVERFASEELGAAGGGSGLVADGQTSEVLVANQLSDQVEVYAFAPRPPGPPLVEHDSVFPAHVSATQAEARAMIDPDGAPTRYRVQYGEVECAAHEASCTEASPTPPDEKEGFETQEVAIKLTGLAPSTTYHFRVIVENDLAEGAKRVVSEEHTFITQSSPVEASLLDGRGWELVTPPEKDGSEIYAIRKEGGLIESAAGGEALAYIAAGPVGQNQPQGSRAPEPAQIIATHDAHAPVGTDPWTSEDVNTGSEAPSQGLTLGGPWEYQAFASDLSSSLLGPVSENPLNVGEAEEALPGRDLYVRDTSAAACEAEGASVTPCFLPLVTAKDYTATTKEPLADAKLEVQATTPDMSHVVFSSQVALTASATATSGHQGLYMWTAGKRPEERLQLISVLPGGEPDSELSFTGGKLQVSGEGMSEDAISEDGSHIVWNSGEQHLFMSTIGVNEKGEPAVTSIPVDEPNATGITPGGREGRPKFQAASADGSTVFFTEGRRLTGDAKTTEEDSSELYVFEASKPVGERVTDISPSLINGDGAGVMGQILGVGREGSVAYFVANGVLSNAEGVSGEHAREGDCFVATPGTHGCNLYVVHRNSRGKWEAPRFIARVSSEDAPDWGVPETKDQSGVAPASLGHQTARVSPNGEYLAFMSDQRLTHYNNTDANSGMPDEEVFLYHFEAEGPSSLVCASCNPSGSQPVGVEDLQNGGEGEGLAVDRPEIWAAHAGTDHWLAGSVPGWTRYGLQPALYQSRYLSNDGRLFFNSADALVNVAKPTREETIEVGGRRVEAEVGVENVYEYEPDGTGTCDAESENTARGCVQLISSGESEHESAFLDASEEASNVFFLTDSRLTAWDTDGALDIYDARICKPTASEPSPEPCTPPPPTKQPPCTAEECRPPATPVSPLPGAASNVSSGSVNLSSAGANLAPSQQVLATKTEQKPKSLSRSQLLAKALKSCKREQKSKRAACERQARKRYGAKKASRGHKAGFEHDHHPAKAAASRARA
jgi:NHL repeat